MNLGAEPKKLAALGAVVLVGIYVVYSNSTPDVPPQQQQRPVTAPRPPVDATLRPATSTPAVQRASTVTRGATTRVMQEFRPSLKPKKPEDRPDPATVDPTLLLGILAKLNKIEVQGMHRSIFDFGTPPPPPVDPKVLAKVKVPDPVVPPANPQATSAMPPTPPPPPPIPFKFYGYVNAANQGARRAFFLDGDDIHVVTEGDLVNKRYRIVRIGVNSVVVEDTDNKNQQTVPLIQEQPG
jgi:hypothetical protein